MEGPSPEILGALGGMFAENPDAIRLVGQGGEVLLRNVAAMDFPSEGLGHLCAEERRGRDERGADRLALGRGRIEGWHAGDSHARTMQIAGRRVNGIPSPATEPSP